MKNVNRISKILILTLLISASFAQPGRDLTGTEVSAVAFSAGGESHTTVEFNVSVVSPDFNFADGVRFTFGESVNILDAFMATELDMPAAVIISGNEVLFGDSSDGVFNGDGIFLNDNEYMFVVHIDGSVQAPIDINYTIYDDGWAQDYCINENNCEQCNDYGWGIDCDGNYITVVMNAEGTVSISEIDIIAAPSQSPVIMDLVDVDNDQGKQMILSWHPGDLMELPYFTEFSVYRYSPDQSDFGTSPNGVFYGEYFSSPGAGGSPDFGELILTREDSLININFDQNPIPVNDDFQVRWSGDIHAPSAGTYSFRTHSDDGVRLFIDGVLVIDRWYDFPPTSHSGSIELEAGLHSLVLEYYENGGGAECTLYWTPPGLGESVVSPVGTSLSVSDLGTWDYLNTVPWVGDEPYAALVNTIQDEVPTAFRVTAHTDEMNMFFHSQPAFGSSYDNIAPPPPGGLVATVSENTVSLSWNPSNVEDFNYYSVHRALDSLFQPNLTNFIGYSSTPMYTDDTAPWNVPIYYKVSATDMGGNLGPGSGSASAHIFVNRAPEMFDVAISPAVPLEGDSINVSYTFFDPDGDDEVGTTRAWYKNGVVTEYTGLTLPSTATACGEEWYITLTPSDGELFGPIVSSNVVTICGVNTAPVWNDSIPEFHIAEDSQGNEFEISGLVSDAEQATSQLVLSVAGNTNDSKVSASFEGSKLILSAISADFYGPTVTTLTLRADDGNEISDVYVEVGIDPVNDNPTITEYLGANSFDEDESYLFEVYDFAIFDPDNDAVDMTLSILPGDNYIRTLSSPGLITTAPNFNGEIDVHVEILDGAGGATITIVSMMVEAVNDPAYLITTGLDVINNGSATEEQSYTVTMSWKDPDGTEDASVYDVMLGGPASNWLDITNVYSSGSGPNLEYKAILTGTPDDVNLSENDISFSVIDNSEGQATDFVEYFYIVINAVNDAPSVEGYNGPMAIEEDGSLILSVDKFAVVDVDNSPIDFSFVLYPGDNYTVSSDFSTIYPSLNYNGTINVSAMVSDGEKSDSIGFSLDVTPVNDALVLAEIPDGTVTEETSYSATISWSDIDGASVDSYSILLDGSASEWVIADSVISGSGSLYSVVLSGTPDDENIFQNDLSITVTDQSEGDPISQSIYTTISVTPVNDAPVVVDFVGVAQVDEEGDFTASINDFIVEDVDNDFPFDFTVYAVSGENYTASSGGSYITPSENFNGSLTVNYIISDGGIDIPFSISVEVMPVNDNPVLEAYVGSGIVDEDNSLEFTISDFTITDPDVGNVEMSITYSEGFQGTSDGDRLTEVGWTGSRGSKLYYDDSYGWFAAKNGAPSSRIFMQTNENPILASNRIGAKLSTDFASNSNNGLRWIVKVNGSWYFSNDFGINNDHGDISYSNSDGFNIAWASNIIDINSSQWYLWNVNASYIENDWNSWVYDSPAESGDAIALPEGDITNFGIYMENTSNGQMWAVDNFSIVSGSTNYLIYLNDGDNYSVSASGYTLTPNSDYNGLITVTASVADEDGGVSNDISFNIEVNPVNDAPTIENLAISPAVPDYSDNLVVTYSFSDVDGDTENGTVVQWYKNGELQSETTNTVPFGSTLCNEEWYAVITPADGAASGISYASNSVTICGSNTPPEWTWDGTYRLFEDSSAVINLYEEMIDNEQAPSQINYTLLSQASPSFVAANIDGHELHLESIVSNYTAAYADTLVIKADDGGYQDTTTVVINIAPVNDAPLAVDDSYNVDEGGTIVADAASGMLANDVDVDGDLLQIIVVDDPVNGTLQVNSDQSFSYTHDGGETSSDVFTYKAYDNEYTSNVATAVISVNAVNDPPEIVYASAFETAEDTPFDMTLGDFVIEDPDTDIGSMTLQISDGSNYTADVISSGYTITPAENFAGDLIVPVSVSDGDTASAVLDVLVEVIGGNDAPVIVSPMTDILVDEDAESIVVSLNGSDTDPYFIDEDGDNLVFAAYTAESGLVTPIVDGDTLRISFVENAYGDDTLFVSATDVGGESVTDTVLVGVSSVNDAPVIFTAAYFVTEEEDSVHVSINDFVYGDVDNEDSELSLVLYAGEGYRVDPITNGYAVTPDPEVVDTLYIPAAIYDGVAASDLWDLMVIVLPENDAPVVVNAAVDIFVDEDADDIVINLMGSEAEPYFSDSDGDTLNFDVYVSGLGVLSAEVDMDSLRVTFYQNMYGYDSLFITATDPSGDYVSDTILVTVASVNDAPRIVDAPSFETDEDDSLDIYMYDFVIRDEDSMEDDISIEVSAYGDSLDGETQRDDLVIVPIDFGFRLIPNENFFGDIPLVITAFDGISYSDPYFTNLNVLPVNDIVEMVAPLADISAEEDSDPVSISLTGTETAPYFVDVDGDSINFTVTVTGSDIFEVMIDNDNMEIVFVENMNGVDTVHVSATDGSGAFVVDTIVVSVMPVNDAPNEFSLLSPADSAEVIITAASLAQSATIDVSWSASEDIDGDVVGYGFVLFNGPYSIQTEALYSIDLEFTELSIPHSAAIGLLEAAGYQSLTCDWLVFATDGQDTTTSSTLRTLTIDARPVLSVDEAAVPEVFALHQNYPNPFNPTTTIKYDLPEAHNVEVMIYDIMGRKVRTLISEYQDVGYRSIQWDATDDYGRGISAGMYIYTIQAGDFRQVRKMILLK